MELILIKDVENVGKKGEVVRVRDGYARNFLLPQNSAIAATRANRQFVEEQRARAKKRFEQDKLEASQLADKISELKIVIQAKAGEKDKLFGSVTNEDVCNAVNENGYSFKRKQVHIKEPIRSLGTYEVSLDVFPEVKATITLDVVQQS